MISSLGIWTLEEAKLQAATENSVSSPSLENYNVPSAFTKQITAIANGENIPTGSVKSEGSSVLLRYQFTPPPILIAAPENFNPSLRSLPPPPPPPPKLPPLPKPPSASTKTVKPAVVLENIQTDFRYDTDKFGQKNLFIEPTAQFRLRNGNKLRLKTGFNYFDERDIEAITNIPIQIGWEGKINQLILQTAVGVDLFDRLPTELNLNAKVEAPLSVKVSKSGKLLSSLIVSGELEREPYKFNAKTLENEISTWRFGPNLFWQIDPNTSFFSSFRFGNYSDGNYERQLFSRLERKFGQFFLAGNLFNWSYDRDRERESGYFSPPDFLVYNAEIGWEGDVVKFLRCRLAANLGQQRLQGVADNANSYQARCTAKLSPKVEADLGYSFSNVRNQNTAGSSYGGNSLTGQLRIKF